jgi:hypothetical protein
MLSAMIFGALLAAARTTPPHLDGIFVSINAVTANWTVDEWMRDLQSMKAARLSFFVIAHVAIGKTNTTADCPTGKYEAYLPVSNPCFTQIGDLKAPGGTVGNVLRAAAAAGLRVHLGLGLNSKFRNGNAYAYMTAGGAKAFASTQLLIAQALWAAANASSHVAGFYTVVEENNGKEWLGAMDDFATHLLNPLAEDIKAWRSDLLVWSSPYGVANRSRYAATEWVPQSVYAAIWEQAFLWAPSFDFVAQQDSMGFLKNSYEDVAAFLGNLSTVSARQGRRMWSNVELFEAWPESCSWPSSCGRHPAPFERIRKQIANEAAALAAIGGSLIAWEWTSCLSPNGGGQWPNATRANYEAYRAYLGN